MYHSTLGSSVVKQKKEEVKDLPAHAASMHATVAPSGDHASAPTKHSMHMLKTLGIGLREGRRGVKYLVSKVPL